MTFYDPAFEARRNQVLGIKTTPSPSAGKTGYNDPTFEQRRVQVLSSPRPITPAPVPVVQPPAPVTKPNVFQRAKTAVTNFVNPPMISPVPESQQVKKKSTLDQISEVVSTKLNSIIASVEKKVPGGFEAGVKRVKEAPASSYVIFAQPAVRQYFGDTLKSGLNAIKGAGKLTQPYIAYRAAMGKPVTPKEHAQTMVETGAEALNFAWRIQPEAPLVGAGLNSWVGVRQYLQGKVESKDLMNYPLEGINKQPGIGQVVTDNVKYAEAIDYVFMASMIAAPFARKKLNKINMKAEEINQLKTDFNLKPSATLEDVAKAIKNEMKKIPDTFTANPIPAHMETRLKLTNALNTLKKYGAIEQKYAQMYGWLDQFLGKKGAAEVKPAEMVEPAAPAKPAELPSGKTEIKPPEKYTSPVEEQSYLALIKDPDKMINTYFEKYGNITNADNAKDMFRETGYKESGINSDEVQRPSSELSNQVYQKALVKFKGTDGNEVLMTMGGPGSGKSSAALDALGKQSSDYSVVNDSTGANFTFFNENVKMALANGYKVKIGYVYRDPVKAFADGVLKRDRYVGIDDHISRHINATQSIKKALEEYRDNPDIEFYIIDNSKGMGEAKLVSEKDIVAFINGIEYNEADLQKQLRYETEQALNRKDRPISQDFADKLLSVSPGREGAEVGKQPEPERQGEPQDNLVSPKKKEGKLPSYKQTVEEGVNTLLTGMVEGRAERIKEIIKLPRTEAIKALKQEMGLGEGRSIEGGFARYQSGKMTIEYYGDANNPKKTQVFTLPKMLDEAKRIFRQKTQKPEVQIVVKPKKKPIKAIVEPRSPEVKLNKAQVAILETLKEAIASGDLEGAKAYFEAVKADLPVKFDDVVTAIDEEQRKMIEEVKAEIEAEGVEADAPTTLILDIADKLMLTLKKPGMMFRFTGKGKGDLASFLDNSIYATDIEGFAKKVREWSDKYNDQFTEISNSISKGDIDGADYEAFKQRIAKNRDSTAKAIRSRLVTQVKPETRETPKASEQATKPDAEKTGKVQPETSRGVDSEIEKVTADLEERAKEHKKEAKKLEKFGDTEKAGKAAHLASAYAYEEAVDEIKEAIKTGEREAPVNMAEETNLLGEVIKKAKPKPEQTSMIDVMGEGSMPLQERIRILEANKTAVEEKGLAGTALGEEVERTTLEKQMGGGLYSGSPASIDVFADLQNVTKSIEKYKVIEFPELVRMSRELMGGVPSVEKLRYRKSLGGVPLGLFVPAGKGKVKLNPDLFKDPSQAAKTLAHEMGHLTDYLPEGTMKRGNLLGRIASLYKYMKGLYGDLKNTVVRDELKELTQLWKPFDEEKVPKKFKSYRYSSKELYADAISVLFNDPELLKKIAPTFYKGFFDNLDSKPAVKDNFFKIQELLDKGQEAVLTEREKDIREMFKKGEDLYKVKLLERQRKQRDYVFRLKHELSDKNQAVIDLIKKARKENKFIPDDKNPIYYLEENNYIGGKLKAWLEKNIQPIYKDIQANGVTWEDFGEVLFLERVINERGAVNNPIQILRERQGNAVGDTIEDMVQDFIDKHLDDMPPGLQIASAENFLDYLESKSVTTQLQMLKAVFKDYIGPNGKSLYDEMMAELPLGIANPLGYDVQSATTQLEYLEKQLGDKYKVVRRNLAKYREAIKGILPEAAEAGLYSPSLVNKLMANPAYATFQVLDYLDTYIPASIKHQVGTLKDIANPADSTIQKTLSTIRAIEKNKTKKVLVDFLQKNFPGEIKPARTIWTGKTKIPIESKEATEGMITLMENGKYTGYYVDPYIAESVANMSIGEASAVISVLRFFHNKLFRPLFITYNTGFQAFNLVRDFMRFYKNTPHLSLSRAFTRYAESLPAAYRRAWDLPDKTIQEMENAKILSMTYNDIVSGMTDEDKQIDLILRRVGLGSTDTKRNFFLRTPLKILDTIERFGNLVETIPKVAGYKHLQGKIPDKELASFIRTSVGSPDFLRRGAGYGWYNEVFLFSNSIKEGIRSDYKVAFKNPRTRAGYWWKTAWTTFLPKLIMFGTLYGMFGTAVKKMMEDVSEYDKANYTVIPLGRDKNGLTVYLRIPQDETGRVLGGILWKALRMANNNKPVLTDLTDLLSYTGGQIPSISPTIQSLFATTQFMAGQNPYDFFRGSNVIPDEEFKAGGKYALKPFLNWQFNQLGGSTFMRLTNTMQSPSDKTWLQKITDSPVLSNVVGRWIKTSNAGQREKNWQIIENVTQEDAKRRLEERNKINDAIKEYKSGSQDIDRRHQIEKQLVKDIVGEPPYEGERKTKVTNTVKKFRIGIIKGEADANINAVISANTNAAKIQLLQDIKTQLEPQEYKDLLKLLKKERIISDEVLKAVR